MKKLITIGTFGLALSLPSLSFASDHMGWLPIKPLVKSEVRNRIKDGSVEKDFTSFYISLKEANSATSLRADRKSDDDKDYIVVFGVRIPVSPRT